jgi:hypothetical protein
VSDRAVVAVGAQERLADDERRARLENSGFGEEIDIARGRRQEARGNAGRGRLAPVGDGLDCRPHRRIGEREDRLRRDRALAETRRRDGRKAQPRETRAKIVDGDGQRTHPGRERGGKRDFGATFERIGHGLDFTLPIRLAKRRGGPITRA